MRQVQSKSPEEIGIAAITLAELEYGVVRSRDRERNRAGQAKSRGLILVTNNERKFKRVEGLRVENWTKRAT
jgi:predicted nucleic acid-binding protein